MEPRDFHVGDIFRLYDNVMGEYRNVILSRIVLDKEHFYLVSMHSFEPWTTRVISSKDIYSKTSLTMDEVAHLAGTSKIEHIGSMFQFRAEMDTLLKSA